MELTAVIRALESAEARRATSISSPTRSTSRTASRRWIHGWKRNGWKTARPEAGQERRPVARARRARRAPSHPLALGARATAQRRGQRARGRARQSRASRRDGRRGAARARLSQPARFSMPPREHLHLLLRLLVALAAARPRCRCDRRRAHRSAARLRRAPCRAASTPPCSCAIELDRARKMHRPPLAASPAFRYSLPSEKRSSAPSLPAASMRSKFASARRTASAIALISDELAALAVDAAHRIDHLAILAFELAFDRRVQPAFGPAPIDDPLRELVRRDWEREDRVAVRRRRSPTSLNADFLLARRQRDVVARRRRAARCAGTRSPASCPASTVWPDAEQHAAAQRHPVLAELALVDRAAPAAVRARTSESSDGERASAGFGAGAERPGAAALRGRAGEAQRGDAARACTGARSVHACHCGRASGRLSRRFCGLSFRRCSASIAIAR